MSLITISIAIHVITPPEKLDAMSLRNSITVILRLPILVSLAETAKSKGNYSPYSGVRKSRSNITNLSRLFEHGIEGIISPKAGGTTLIASMHVFGAPWQFHGFKGVTGSKGSELFKQNKQF